MKMSIHAAESRCRFLILFGINFIQGELRSISQKQNIFINKHKLWQVHLRWLPYVCRKMLIFVNKHPYVLVLVCLVTFLYTINYKLILCQMLLPLVILADVVPKVVAAVIAIKTWTMVSLVYFNDMYMQFIGLQTLLPYCFPCYSLLHLELF